MKSILASLMVLVAANAFASDRSCPAAFTLSSTAETAVTDVRKFSNPWAAWLKVDSGSPVVNVNGYGPCLDVASPCTRTGPYVLGTIRATSTCVAGTNAGAACTAASECPLGACIVGTMIRGDGPIEAVSFTATTCVGTCGRVTFCGTAAGGVQ